jgi:poly-gamma-glutamate system protein
MPGGNIAVYCALEEMGVHPRIITSVGASQWGANIGDFTWLDMERILAEAGLISNRTIAASLGGGSDIGRRLSPGGRQIVEAAIARNEITPLLSKDLEDAINNRIVLYSETQPLSRYAAFINIGGGAAVLGDAITARLIQPGLTMQLDLQSLRSRGVIAHFGRAGVPLIHILSIREMFGQFDYPYAATPAPELGSGTFYSSEHYSPLATTLALIILLGMLITVGLNSKRKIRHYLEQHEPDSYV